MLFLILDGAYSDTVSSFMSTPSKKYKFNEFKSKQFILIFFKQALSLYYVFRVLTVRVRNSHTVSGVSTRLIELRE